MNMPNCWRIYTTELFIEPFQYYQFLGTGAVVKINGSSLTRQIWPAELFHLFLSCCMYIFYYGHLHSKFISFGKGKARWILQSRTCNSNNRLCARAKPDVLWCYECRPVAYYWQFHIDLNAECIGSFNGLQALAWAQDIGCLVPEVNSEPSGDLVISHLSIVVSGSSRFTSGLSIQGSQGWRCMCASWYISVNQSECGGDVKLAVVHVLWLVCWFSFNWYICVFLCYLTCCKVRLCYVSI